MFDTKPQPPKQPAGPPQGADLMAAIIRSSGKEPKVDEAPAQKAPATSQSIAPKKGGLFDDDDQDPDESLMFDSKPQ